MVPAKLQGTRFSTLVAASPRCRENRASTPPVGSAVPPAAQQPLAVNQLPPSLPLPMGGRRGAAAPACPHKGSLEN